MDENTSAQKERRREYRRTDPWSKKDERPKFRKIPAQVYREEQEEIEEAMASLNEHKFDYPKDFYQESALEKAVADLESANDEDAIIKYRSQIRTVIQAAREKNGQRKV